LARIHARELEHGNRNRATLAVARKLVGYLLAVDRRQSPFQRDRNTQQPAAWTAAAGRKMRPLELERPARPCLGGLGEGRKSRGQRWSVSGLAGEPKLNLRRRRPPGKADARDCKWMSGSALYWEVGTMQTCSPLQLASKAPRSPLKKVKGHLRLPLTKTYHGCPNPGPAPMLSAGAPPH